MSGRVCSCNASGDEKLGLLVTLEKEFALGKEAARRGNPAIRRVQRRPGSLLLLVGSSFLFLSLLLKSRFGLDAGVEREVVASNITNGLDLSSLSKVPEESPGDRSINLELFHDGRASEAQNLGHFGADLVEALLVEEDLIVELVLDLGLGPGLLLGLGALRLLGLSALGSGRSLIFG